MTWEYDSPLNVVETITDTGGGDYRYEYSFTNVDTSTIWHFNLYTTFNVQPENTFNGYDRWVGPHFATVEQYGIYDPRILDDDIIGGLGTSYEYWAYGEIYGIMPNNYATGFSYLSTSYDPSPKYYAYTTIETNGDMAYWQGVMSAVGQTIPEPTTLSFFALGAVLLKRKR